MFAQIPDHLQLIAKRTGGWIHRGNFIDVRSLANDGLYELWLQHRIVKEAILRAPVQRMIAGSWIDLHEIPSPSFLPRNHAFGELFGGLLAVVEMAP